MTQQEALNLAYRQLPNPNDYEDEWCTIRFNSEKVVDAWLRVDANYIENFDSTLPFEVEFHKVNKDGVVAWELTTMDFGRFDDLDKKL